MLDPAMLNPYYNVQHTQPAPDPDPQFSDDDISSIDTDEIPDFELLAAAHDALASNDNFKRQEFAANFNSHSAQRSKPVYRTPDCRRPAALVPLNMGRSAPDLAPNFYTGTSDPWKPKPLPTIPRQGFTPRRSDSDVLNQKPVIPSLATPMKPPVLPGIGQRPLPGIGQRPLPGIKSDRAI